MRKVVIFLGFWVFFFALATPTKANLLKIDSRGEIIWTVLGSENLLGLNVPKSSELSITKVEGETGVDSSVFLVKSGEKVELNVTSNDEEKTLDVSGLSGDLVEIEERPFARTVKIGIYEGKFSIEQGGAVALTDYSINIDPKSAELSISTPSGKHYLAILPLEAIETAMRAKVLNKPTERMSLNEEVVGQVVYKLEGDRVINLFNITSLAIPVRASISASTGEIVNLDQPAWLRVLGFLFS